jgi:integrase
MPVKVPKLCHFKPRNLACVWVSPDKRIYLGEWGTAEAQERYAEVVRRILLGLDVTEAPTIGSGAKRAATMLTVRQLADRYIDHARDYYRREGIPTGEAYVAELSINAAVKQYGDLPAIEFGPLALEAVRDRMIADKLSRKTINSRVRRIVAAFKWAAAKEMIPSSTHHSLTMVSGLRIGRTKARETKPVQPVADDVVDATLPHLPPIVADMVQLQRLTGMRPGEVCAVRPCDIDRTGDVWTYTPATHKTQHHGKTRTVFIGERGQAILLKYLARRSDSYCFSPQDSEAKRRAEQFAARVTPLNQGDRPGTNVKESPLRTIGDHYTKDSYGRAVSRACELAWPAPDNFDREARREWNAAHRWSPNRLRHSYATEIRKQFGLEAAQVMLGHSTCSVTQVYAERDTAKGAAVARQIG